jgi:hypothetical protein
MNRSCVAAKATAKPTVTTRDDAVYPILLHPQNIQMLSANDSPLLRGQVLGMIKSHWILSIQNAAAIDSVALVVRGTLALSFSLFASIRIEPGMKKTLLRDKRCRHLNFSCARGHTVEMMILIRTIVRIIALLLLVLVPAVQAQDSLLPSTCSASTCTNLGWDATLMADYGSPGICGESNGFGLNRSSCSGEKPWAEAVGLGEGVGARLCTAEELGVDDETKASGCSYDLRRSWSSTPCGVDSYIAAFGDSLYIAKIPWSGDQSVTTRPTAP